MKVILGDKLYDTETAELIGRHISADPNSLDGFWEELYRNKNDEFFLIGEGGPYSKYGKFIDSTWYTGGSFYIVTESEARRWAQYYHTTNEHATLF